MTNLKSDFTFTYDDISKVQTTIPLDSFFVPTTTNTTIIPSDKELKFVIQKVYDVSDLDFDGDLMELRLFDELNNLIMSGDDYHNKIEYKVKGFFEALEYLNIKFSIKTEKINEQF